jgi:hypothetical protein
MYLFVFETWELCKECLKPPHKSSSIIGVAVGSIVTVRKTGANRLIDCGPSAQV